MQQVQQQQKQQQQQHPCDVDILQVVLKLREDRCVMVQAKVSLSVPDSSLALKQHITIMMIFRFNKSSTHYHFP
jgi:hypothetical protein